MRGGCPGALAVVLLLCVRADAAPAPPSEDSHVGQDATTGLDAAIDQALAHLDRAEYTEAERRLTPLAARSDLTDGQRARVLRGIGHSLIEQQRRPEAAEPLRRALEIALATGDRSEMGWTRKLTGTLRYGEGRIDEARGLWNLARIDFVEAGDARGEFEVLDDLALVQTGLASRPLLERALALARDQNDPLMEARARARWGHALLDGAHPGAALVQLERAVAIMRPLGRRADAALGDALALLGWALRAHGAHDRAVAVHREAIRVARSRDNLNSQVWNYLGLGVALVELGEEDRAASAIAEGLSVARKTGIPTNVRFLAQAQGWVALRQRRFTRAAALLETARAMPGLDSTVLPLVNLARAYRELRRLDEALAQANEAVEMARRLGVVDGEIQATIEVAHVEEARGDLDAAEIHLSGVMRRLEAYRAELAPVDFLKRGFGDRFTDAYEVYVDLLMRRGRWAEALEVAERSRSRAFADLLATRRLTEAEEAQTASGHWELGSSQPGVGVTSASEAADSVRWVPALSSSELADLARELETTLVVYWIQDAGSYAWVIRAGQDLHAVRIDVSRAWVRRMVRQAVDEVPQAQLTASRSGGTVATAEGLAPFRSLYRALWAPLESWLPNGTAERVTILPNGPLLTLPFAALIDERGRYLLERYAIHYAPSGAVLAQAQRGSLTPARDAHVLLVADPVPLPPAEAGIPLPALAAAREEVGAIAPMLRVPAHRLVGRDASEQRVRDALPRASVVHFATHAVVRDRDPLGSHLLLAPNARTTDPGRDGRLTASEVAALRLSADLVVLGACRSARGKTSSDGVAGLTRAFMAAGAPSVIATLWDVPDVTTSRLMRRFYRAYATGMSKDRALRAAQLALLRDLRAGRVTVRVGSTPVTYAEHPRLWAGAILVGAP